MLYENFGYMVFTCHSAGKIWSSICIKTFYIQDIVCFTLSGLYGTIYLTRFQYQICLTGKSDENDYFYVQNIKYPVKYL